MRITRRFGALSAMLASLVVAEVAVAQPAPPSPEAPSEAAPTDDVVAVEEEDEPDPARPAPAGKGVVWGVISDAASKEPLMEAGVTVVGTKTTVRADYDGRYRLELAPGTYELRVFYELHQSKRIQNVTITADKVERVDVILEGDQAAEEVMEVETTPDRASASAQLVIRKNAAVVGDALSAQEIAKTPDRNAAEAVRRVVGASVVDNRYVYVRGLGDRYTNSLLNGVPLPSPEPDRQAVPLDLFPTLILSDLTIIKSFTPDMPADFAGGSARINTREFPDKPLLQGSFNLGFNSVTTFAERPGYEGGSLDWLGIDDGSRALPGEIPDYKLVKNNQGLTPNDLVRYGKLLNSPMTLTPKMSLPELNGSVVLGDSFKLSNGHELGVVAALTYRRRYTRRVDEIIRTFTPDPLNPGELKNLNDYRAETGIDSVSWGGYGNVTYKMGPNHRIGLTGFYNRSGEIEGRRIEGFNEERQADIRDERMRFQSRALTFGEISGEHKLKSLDDALFDWKLFASSASSYEPDTRETVYVKDASSGVYAWDRGTLSGSHFFGDLGERALGGMADWTQPIIKGDAPTKIKAGVFVSMKAREFDARRFRFINKPGSDPSVYNLPPGELFVDENIGTSLALEEYTRPNDAYTADHNVYAGYLMTDAHLTPKIRLITGARLEASKQTIDSFDPFAAELTSVKAELATVDFLPSANLVFKTTKDSNLRFSFARTVARPQLRELAPFSFTDYFGARDIQGNPNLRRTSIYNADMRFEVFPKPGEVMAVSVFYKQFYDPIEQIILPTSRGVISYENADSARNAGLELELRKGLGFLTPVLADAGLLANVTLVSSTVTLSEQALGVQTNSVRPLAGQSPYVINLGLDYNGEATGTRGRLLYNIFGPRITQVGSEGLDDVYEQPRHQVDLMVSQMVGKHVDLRATVENLLNSPIRFTQGRDAQETNVVNEYRAGTTVRFTVTVSN